MIVVRVELWSAVDGSKTELARMHIANDGERLRRRKLRRPRRRDAATLAKGRVSKRGEVRNWRRHDFHIWNLVRRMLESMGYDK